MRSRQLPARHAQPIWQTVLTAALLGSLTLIGPSPPADAATPPNIVLIVTDDQKLTSLARMPYLSGAPGDHWVHFENAFVNFPLCCPSRATILSGLYPHHHGVRSNNQGASFNDSSTIATWLDGAGYYTALIGKYLNKYPWSRSPDTYIPPGWDHWIAFRKPEYYDYQLNENGTWVSYRSQPADYSTDVLAAKATAMLETATEPFFLHFDTWAPHETFTPAPRHQDAYAGLPPDLPPNFNEADVSDKPAWVRNLSLMTSSQQESANNRERSASESLLAVDEAIASMIETLTARGILDNTILIFTTDNGFSYGSHRWQGKRCVYEECVRVPLLIRYPAAASRTATELVSNVDIAPTIADLADVTIPYAPDGMSVVPLLDGAATGWRTSLLLQHEGTPAGFWAVRTAEWTYSELLSGERELYDLTADPYQLSNVAGQPAYADVQAALAAELQLLKGGPPPPPAPTGLSATPGDNQVQLSWNASADAASYNVYRRTAGSYGSALKTGITATSYTDTTAANGQTYFYVVRAFNGAESPNSNEVSATPSSGGGGGGGTPVTFGASEDAYVKEAVKGATYNTTVLQIYRAVNSSATNEQWSYLKFSTDLGGAARLRLRVTSGSSSSNFGDAYAVGSEWSEATLTWATKPSLGGVLDSTHRYVGGWVEWDLGTLPAGTHSFVVANTGSTVRAFASSEATTAANRPQLVLTPPAP